MDMDVIKNLRMAYGNETINEEYKNRIISTLEKYNMPTETFKNNLKDIKILKSKDESVVGDYLCNNNAISYIDEESYIHELMHAASNVGRVNNGIVLYDRGRKIGDALNEGITDLYACRAGNKHSNYPFEKYCAEIIENLYGSDLFKSYFNNDGSALYERGSELYLMSKELDLYKTGMINIYNLINDKNNDNIDKIVKKIDEIRKVFLKVFLTLREYSDFLDKNNTLMDDRLDNEDLETVMQLLNIDKNKLKKNKEENKTL